MKRLHIIGFLFLIGFVWGCGTTPTEVVVENTRQIKNIKHVAVFPFICNRSETGRIIAGALAANLDPSRFVVMERDRLQQQLAQQHLTPTEVSENHQAAVGKLNGLDAIITGDAAVRMFSGYSEHVAEANARMIDMTTGEILLEVAFSSEDARRIEATTPAEQIGKALGEKISSY